MSEKDKPIVGHVSPAANERLRLGDIPGPPGTITRVPPASMDAARARALSEERMARRQHHLGCIGLLAKLSEYLSTDNEEAEEMRELIWSALCDGQRFHSYKVKRVLDRMEVESP